MFKFAGTLSLGALACIRRLRLGDADSRLRSSMSPRLFLFF
jgi:hypothetical protein